MLHSSIDYDIKEIHHSPTKCVIIFEPRLDKSIPLQLAVVAISSWDEDTADTLRVQSDSNTLTVSAWYDYNFSLIDQLLFAPTSLALVPSLTLNPIPSGYTFIDSVSNNYFLEVVDSTTNTFVSATPRTEKYQPNETRYVWARYRDIYGVTGSWSTVQIVTIPAITSANTANSLVSVTPTTGNFTGFSPTVSANNTWYTVGYTEFTAQTDDYIHLTPIVIYEVSGVTNSGTPASDVLAVYLRSYLLDVTVSGSPFVVEGSLRVIKPFKLIGTKQFGGLAHSDAMPETHLTGFRGLLSPSRTYRYMTDISKVIEAGTPSCTVSLYQYAPVVSFSRFS